MAKLYLAGVLLSLAAAAALTLYSMGRRDQIKDVDDANKDALDAAVWAELGRQQCVAVGGVWDFAASECEGSQ